MHLGSSPKEASKEASKEFHGRVSFLQTAEFLSCKRRSLWHGSSLTVRLPHPRPAPLTSEEKRVPKNSRRLESPIDQYLRNITGRRKYHHVGRRRNNLLTEDKAR